MFGATDVRTQVLCTQSQVLPHIVNLLGLISSTALPVWSTAMHTLFYLGQDLGRRSKPSDPAAGFVCSDTFQPCGMGTATCLNETTRHHRCRAAENAARPQTKSWLPPFPAHAQQSPAIRLHIPAKLESLAGGRHWPGLCMLGALQLPLHLCLAFP